MLSINKNCLFLLPAKIHFIVYDASFQRFFDFLETFKTAFKFSEESSSYAYFIVIKFSGQNSKHLMYQINCTCPKKYNEQTFGH